MVQLSHPHMTTGKTTALTIWTFVGQVMSLLFNTLSRFVIASLPGSKCLLVLWLQLPSTVLLEPKKMKSDIVSTFSPSICHEVTRLDAMIFVFLMLSFKPAFSLSFFIFIKRLLSSSSLSGKPIKPPKQCKIWSVYSDVQFPEEKIHSFQMILKREYCLFKKLRGQISSAFLRKTEHSVKSFKKYF